MLDLQVDYFRPEMLKSVVAVGISSLTGKQISYGLDVAKLIRKLNPDIPIVWGGIHPSTMAEQTIKNPFVDYIVYGEGETTFPILLNALTNKKSLNKIEGIVYQVGSKIIINKPRPFINFNKYNKLPYNLLDLSKYKTNERFSYQSSRGCPFGCLFCYNKKFNLFKWRSKDSKIVLDELEYIKKTFNPRYLFFIDDEFFINKKRTFNIIKGIVERNLNFIWKSSVRIDMINRFTEDEITLLEKSGCFELTIGAESGSNRILKFVNKNIEIADTFQSAKKLLNSRIIPQYSFMGGFPGETLEEFHMTLDAIDKLWKINKNIKVNGLFVPTPFPGTDLFNIVSKIKDYQLPQTLEEWGNVNINFLMNRKNFPYLSRTFLQEIQNYSTIIRFLFLWSHSSSFIKNKNNKNTLKYYKFILFLITFYPFYLIIKFRWTHKFVKFPIDLNIIKNIFLKIVPD